MFRVLPNDTVPSRTVIQVKAMNRFSKDRQRRGDRKDSLSYSNRYFDKPTQLLEVNEERIMNQGTEFFCGCEG